GALACLEARRINRLWAGVPVFWSDPWSPVKSTSYNKSTVDFRLETRWCPARHRWCFVAKKSQWGKIMNNSLHAIVCAPLAAVLLLTLVPHTACADEAASATGAVGPEAPATTGAGATARGETLEEVIVTATRREE